MGLQIGVKRIGCGVEGQVHGNGAVLGAWRLEVVKTNLCRYAEALGVRLDEGGSGHELHELDESLGSARDRLDEWGEGGGPSLRSGSDSVPLVRYGEAPEAYREPTQAEACAGWLVEVLGEAGEPMRPKEVLEMGEAAGFKQGVVYRARKELEGTVVNTEGKMSLCLEKTVRSTSWRTCRPAGWPIAARRTPSRPRRIRCPDTGR